jgi:hypothetical protein
MRARLPQTNKEEYKKRQQRKTKKISAGKRKPTAADGRLGEREREREKEKVTESEERERGEKKQEKVSVLFWKNGIYRTKTAAVTRQPD